MFLSGNTHSYTGSPPKFQLTLALTPALDEPGVIEAFDRLKLLADGWHEVDASDGIREAAVRFLRVHTLRATDALQLAAAFVAAERRPSSLEVVTLDERLAGAARKEGFVLIEVLPSPPLPPQ